MRRLIAILLTLWLPLQATAGLAMASCKGHELQHLASTTSVSGEHHDAALDGHSPSVEAAPDVCSQGAQCTLQCVQFLCGDASLPGLRMAENAPMRHLLKLITQAPPEAIHRPPIALAA